MQINKVIGFQQFISSSLTSAVACSTALLKEIQSGGISANAAVFSVGGSTGAVRWRDDGTAPTSNIGMRMPAGVAPYLYQGDLQKLQFIVDSVPGNADMNITYVRVSD